jgi:hypothetical protein
MKDIRCLVGVHDWSTELPRGVQPQFSGPALMCRRCGRFKRHTDARRELPPEAHHGG